MSSPIAAVGAVLLALLHFGPPAPAPALAPALAPAPAPAPNTDTDPSTPTSELPPPPVPGPEALRVALAQLPATPTLAQVQTAALARANIRAELASGWRRRARMAAALPTVSLQYDRRVDQGWTLDEEVGAADALRNDAGQQHVVRARASWELDRLWFNPDELRASRAGLDLADAREQVLIEVTRLFFERERLLLELALGTAPTLDATIAATVRVREIEGLLAGITGLDFADHATKSVRDATTKLGPRPRR